MNKISNIDVNIISSKAKNQIIVKISSDNGNVGIGEAWWGIPDKNNPGKTAMPIASVIENILAPKLIGKNPDEIEKHWFDLWDYGYRYGDQGIYLMGLSGIDIALWDLLGKTNKISVMQILGGAVHDSLPCYASLPPLRDTKLVIKETKRAIEKGINAVKLHEVETKYVSILRKEFGESLKIMVDVNGHYNFIEALEAGNEMAKYNVTWFEEPVRPMRDHHAIKEIGIKTKIPIAAGENEYSINDFKRLLDNKTVTYLQPEITKIGGITAAKRLTVLTELYNIALCPHNFSIGPSLYASIHWAFASPMSRWIEIPWVPNDFDFNFYNSLPEIHNGKINVPKGHGLGLK